LYACLSNKWFPEQTFIKRKNGFMSDIAEYQKHLHNYPQTSWLDAYVADVCGRAIGKRLPRCQIKSLYSSGSPLCAAMQLVDALGSSADPMGYGFSDGDPDAYIVPIEDTLVPVPWRDDKYAQVLCQFISGENQQPLWHEPRHVLRQVLQRFQELQLTPVVAVELECYLLRQQRLEDGTAMPASSPLTGLPETQGRVLSLEKLDEFAELFDAINSCCEIQKIPATTMLSEYGAGQFEINLQHQTDALQAADHAVMLRRAIVGMTRKHSMDATFMSKPFADQSGSGMHIHVSLLDKNGDNVFSPKSADGDSILQQAIAGLQQTMAESMAIFAPNLNVYRRYKPDEFVPITKDWGENNRSMAFRLPISDADNRRIEHRVSGADANPYLVIAAVLSGIHHGLTNKLKATPKARGNVGAEADASLPNTLWDALACLRESKVLPQYLGDSYPGMYADVKQAELDSFLETIFAREHQWYL
jgi:glutamine synthetase